MRHKVFGRKLNRDVKERKALFRSLVYALIKYGKIRTTLAKAKAIRGLIEKLVTKAKDGSSSSLRQVSSFLTKKDLITKLTKEIAPKFADKIGGYIRIRRVGFRTGDNAEEVTISWTLPEEKKAVKIKDSKDKKVKEKQE